jgi:hypothetical protein
VGVVTHGVRYRGAGAGFGTQLPNLFCVHAHLFPLGHGPPCVITTPPMALEACSHSSHREISMESPPVSSLGTAQFLHPSPPSSQAHMFFEHHIATSPSNHMIANLLTAVVVLGWTADAEVRGGGRGDSPGTPGTTPIWHLASGRKPGGAPCTVLTEAVSTLIARMRIRNDLIAMQNTWGRFDRSRAALATTKAATASAASAAAAKCNLLHP